MWTKWVNSHGHFLQILLDTFHEFSILIVIFVNTWGLVQSLSRYKDVRGLAELTRKRTRALEDVIDGRPLNCIQSDLNIMQNTFS